MVSRTMHRQSEITKVSVNACDWGRTDVLCAAMTGQSVSRQINGKKINLAQGKHGRNQIPCSTVVHPAVETQYFVFRARAKQREIASHDYSHLLLKIHYKTLPNGTHPAFYQTRIHSQRSSRQIEVKWRFAAHLQQISCETQMSLPHL